MISMVLSIVLINGCVQNIDNKQVTIQRDIGNYTPSVISPAPQFLTQIQTNLSNIQENICSKLGAGFLCPSPENTNTQYCEQTDVWRCRDIYADLPNMTNIDRMKFPDNYVIGKGTNFWISCTDSMYPIINCNENYVAIKVYTDTTLNIGDIIWFTHSQKNSADLTATVHRITAIGQDSGGIYYTTKGDTNNVISDYEQKVRQDHIQFKIIGRYVG